MKPKGEETHSIFVIFVGTVKSRLECGTQFRSDNINAITYQHIEVTILIYRSFFTKLLGA